VCGATWIGLRIKSSAEKAVLTKKKNEKAPRRSDLI
jgi:hypothetical protein